MFTLKFIIIVVILTVNLVHGYKLLLFFPFPGKSHTILAEGYVGNLVKAGHNVTYVTPIPISSNATNLRQIDVSSNFDHFQLAKSLDITKILNKQVDIGGVEVVYKGMHEIAEIALKHEKVQDLFLDTSEEFDVCIIQWLSTDLYAGASTVFECPWIWSSSMDPHAMVLRLIDDIPNPAYIPDHRSNVSPPLNFFERVGELWTLLNLYKLRWEWASEESRVYELAYGDAIRKRGREVPSFHDIKYTASLMFGNSHISSGLPVRLPINYIPIAGYHIKEEVPPLPQNLQKIMDSATHGVIYFSLGSMMKGKTMPTELKQGLLKMFGTLKQIVVWKLEENQPNVPQNVHIVEWAPQASILAHAKTVLFITHGGLLSTTETLHYGVPVIGIPLFADQFLNIERAVNKGYGMHVPLSYNLVAELKPAINEIINNPKYKERVKELQLIYHDRPVSPSKEMVHWVEHVAKTKGAKHLRSLALITPWYQKIYLDLFAVILVFCTVLAIIVKKYLPIVSKHCIKLFDRSRTPRFYLAVSSMNFFLSSIIALYAFCYFSYYLGTKHFSMKSLLIYCR